MNEKKLLRSNNKMVAGVCAGIAEYANVDPTIIRAIWAIITVFSGIVGGSILYVILCIVMPTGANGGTPINNHPGTYGNNGAVTH